VVTLEFTVDKGGAVRNAMVVSAEPARIFDDAALKRSVARERSSMCSTGARIRDRASAPPKSANVSRNVGHGPPAIPGPLASNPSIADDELRSSGGTRRH
jgi:hypothetical protein